MWPCFLLDDTSPERKPAHKKNGDGAQPGAGHNKPKYEWPRFQKKRTFVRALEGTYSHLQQGLLDQPRVFHSTDYKWEGGLLFEERERHGRHQPGKEARPYKER